MHDIQDFFLWTNVIFMDQLPTWAKYQHQYCRDMSLESCDTMDTMPLTPASFAGLNEKVDWEMLQKALITVRPPPLSDWTKLSLAKCICNPFLFINQSSFEHIT